MRKLTSRWVIATLSIVTMLFAAGTLDAGALEESQKGQQRQAKGKPGGGGGGGGNGGGSGGGNGGGATVDVTLDGDLSAGSTTGVIDEGFSKKGNDGNSAPNYWLGASLTIPASGVLTGVALTGGTCGVGTAWQNEAHINVNIDAGPATKGKLRNGPTWGGMSAGEQDVKVHINLQNGHEIRLDEDWYPNDTAKSYSGGAIDAKASCTASSGGTCTAWTIQASGDAVENNFNDSSNPQLCAITIAWSISTP